MVKINVAEAKAHLSKYLQLVEQGEQVIICRRNVPVVELRAADPQVAETRRPYGVMKGCFVVPDSFYEPLPEEEVAGEEPVL